MSSSIHGPKFAVIRQMKELLMKTFRVGCNRIEHFCVNVEATSEEQAIDKAHEILESEGVPKDAYVFDRECNAVCAQLKD